MKFTDIIKNINKESYYLDLENGQAIYCADYRDILPSLCGVSAVVTDPPYELGFMGKGWDKQGVSFQADTWRLILEACLPGSMLLSFGGTRTSHRLACAIEDAGWQIRDVIMWVYGSGFPKSLSIGKSLDKKAGAMREIIGKKITPSGQKYPEGYDKNSELFERASADNTAPTTPEAKLWEGYGTGLKPSYEPIIVAMNPLDGTFANNALKHKVAGLNIDECRIAYTNEKDRSGWSKAGADGSKGYLGSDTFKIRPISAEEIQKRCIDKGRFPSNFIHDGSQEVMELFPEAGNRWKRNYGEDNYKGRQYKGGSFGGGGYLGNSTYSDSGSAARFFYCAKASRAERDAGLEDLPLRPLAEREGRDNTMNSKYTLDGKPTAITSPARNNHPTVKPLALMTYLCKLVKMPEYNLILDPFCGSGSTLLACKKLGIKAIGIDSNEEYCEIAKKRLSQSVIRLGL